MRLGGVALGGRGIERRLRGGLALHQLLLAFEIGLGLLQRRLRGGLGGLRLLQLELIGLRLDGEEVLAPLHRHAVGVLDLGEEALHARDQIGRIDRRGIAGRLEIARDLLLDRLCDRDLGRRRRLIGVALPAGRRGRPRQSPRSTTKAANTGMSPLPSPADRKGLHSGVRQRVTRRQTVKTRRGQAARDVRSSANSSSRQPVMPPIISFTG